MLKRLAAIWLTVALTGAPATAQDLSTVVEPLMEQGQFPGVAVAVFRDGEPVVVESWGQASLEHGVPVTRETVFELASLTKHMTALAILTLEEEGALSLDDPVTDYLDAARPEWASITLDMLLANTGGLTHRFEETVEGVLLTEYSTQDMLESAIATPMHAEPGTDWHYSDQGYFLLGLVIERVTGAPFFEFLETRWFEPLGMTQTRRLDQSAIIAHRATGYGLRDGELVRNRRVWQFGLMSHFGVMSSLNDMVLWEAELSDPSLLSATAIARAAEIQRPFDTGSSCDAWGYARGWMSYSREGRTLVSHGGYAGTAYVRDMTGGTSAIVLTNREDAPGALSPVAIAWAVAHAVDPDIPAGGPTCWE
jgi:CubicO group peptidase (beta-lactamase class C family)